MQFNGGIWNMASYSISKDIIEKINRQLSDIAVMTENTDRDLCSVETMRQVEALNAYGRQLREHIVCSDVSDGRDAAMPFIIIGCTVVVDDKDTGETFDYHIVNTGAFILESNDVTFTSPIGRALLFKQVGDTAEIQAPVGKITYIIRSITLDLDISLPKEPELSEENLYA
jgi:transcription elongation factor GreA